ncbi:MAG: c-type cytochrome domain-containing protein [Opitutaceae bacterium]
MKRVYFLLSTVLLVSLALLLAWVVVFTEGQSAAEESLEWTQFLGRFHPVILHLPIGLFVGLFVVEVAALRNRNEGLRRSAHILVWIMALASVLSAYLGLLLASNGDYSGDTLWLHKWLGIVFSAGALVLAFLKVRNVCKESVGKGLYRFLLVGLLIVMTVVGHYGGNLTHGSGYLTAYAPDWLAAKLDKPNGTIETVASEDGAIDGDVYTHEIQPLLDQYCTKCHGMEKQKSKYRLDTYEYLMTPGKIGDTPITPSAVSESKLIEYLWLPESDDMAMPPEGKPRMSAEQIMLITHWVSNGAEGPPVDEAAVAAAEAAQEAEQDKLNKLIKNGIMVLPVSRESELFYVDFQNAKGAVADEDFALLATYKDRIEELKLAGAEVPIAQLEWLRGASELRALNLSGYSSADAAVDVINSFTALESLNFYGSDLSDAGLSKLSKMSLKSLYLGSTNVTPEQFAAYQNSNDGVRVFGDVDLEAVSAIEAIDLENTADFNPNKK